MTSSRITDRHQQPQLTIDRRVRRGLRHKPRHSSMWHPPSVVPVQIAGTQPTVFGVLLDRCMTARTAVPGLDSNPAVPSGVGVSCGFYDADIAVNPRRSGGRCAVARPAPKPVQLRWQVASPHWTISAAGSSVRHDLRSVTVEGAVLLAEGDGRTPEPFRVQWFSRPPPSTTRPSLRIEMSPEF